jgi:chaperonin GroEL
MNKMRGGLKMYLSYINLYISSCAVKAPAFRGNRKEIMNDIAIITGGLVVTEEVVLSLEKSELLVLGRRKNITIKKDDLIIMNG